MEAPVPEISRHGPGLVLAGWTPGQRDEGLTEKPNVQVHPRIIKTTGGRNLKVREIIKIIEADGWYIVATKGSHRQYKHPEKPGRITIAGHLADDLAPGTLNSIFKQAQFKD
jgi:predicted RNA binding protein YcfA (HicA-like mRNA interferase family)